VVLSSDVSVSCNVEKFHAVFPNRFFEMGIAEQSTMSVAGGFATEGFIPVYVALAIFSCGMTFPQLRQVCNANLNVKVIGTHAGVDDGQDGSGHHATEDIAVTRAIPQLAVLTPSDDNEVAAAIRAMVEYDGPVYMRVAREQQPIIHIQNCSFEIGKAEVIENLGNDFAIVYEGTSLKQAIEGFELLTKKGFCGKLVSLRTIKPLDVQYIRQLANEVELIITVENHSIIGGVYGAVSECLSGMKHKAVVKAVGFHDEFTESGSSVDIKKKYGLTAEAILNCYRNN
jgi:transketolase